MDLGIVAQGTGVTYQWQKDGRFIAGATDDRFFLAAAEPANAGWYSVVVRGACEPWTVSDSVYVGVRIAPAVTEQPRDTIVLEGARVRLSAMADSASATYQWRKGGIAIAGATDPTLMLDSVVVGDGGVYDVVVTGDCGSSTSRSATVEVRVATSISSEDGLALLGSVYPQPAQTSVTIDISGWDAVATYDIQCEFVAVDGTRTRVPLLDGDTDSRVVLDVSRLGSGVYTCVITKGQEVRRVGSVVILR